MYYLCTPLFVRCDASTDRVYRTRCNVCMMSIVIVCSYEQLNDSDGLDSTLNQVAILSPALWCAVTTGRTTVLC